MIQRDITVQVEVTPEEMASEFSTMDATQQASFFTELARQMARWPDRCVLVQINAMTEDKNLTEDARVLMRHIGEYARPGQQ